MQYNPKIQAYYLKTWLFIWEIQEQQRDASQPHMVQLEYNQGPAGICG